MKNKKVTAMRRWKKSEVGLESFLRKQKKIIKAKRICSKYMFVPIIVLCTSAATLIFCLFSPAVSNTGLNDGQTVRRETTNRIDDGVKALEKLPENKSADVKEIVDGAGINLNTASAECLDTLPGIGGVKAKNIVETREQMGGFRSVNDLLNVEGIGEKTLEGLRNIVYVD